MIKALFRYWSTTEGRHLPSLALIVVALFMVLTTENQFERAGHTPLSDQLKVVSSQDQLDPTLFTAAELQYLEKRFGVHGPQPQLAQLLTQGVDQFEFIRSQTIHQLDLLKPVILSKAKLYKVNPMLVTAILFDEIQHSTPGEDHPLLAHSGLVKTYGLAQLGISELIHQKRLPKNPTAKQIAQARDLLLDPESNIELLAGKIARLKNELNLPAENMLQASNSYRHAKAIATLAYLHNGKLDYPARVLRYMRDPELHGIIYSQRSQTKLPII
ncbi:MAG TPA: helicase DnaB [Prochlorococcus sp.]